MEKAQIARNLQKQFSHTNGGKVASLPRDTSITDKESLIILEVFPFPWYICLAYKKLKPKPIYDS